MSGWKRGRPAGVHCVRGHVRERRRPALPAEPSRAPGCPAGPERADGAPGQAFRLCRFRVLAGQVPGDLGGVAGVVDLLGAGRGPVAGEVLPVRAVVEEDPHLATAPAAHRDRFVPGGFVPWRRAPVARSATSIAISNISGSIMLR